jgi:outer membrane receptor protein involved in Fe transport
MHRPLPTAIAFTLAAAALGVPPAFAETPNARPAAEPNRLEDVVVTAQRREESAQSIGLALSVLSADALKDAGVTNVNDLQHATPSLEVEPAFASGQPQFRLRGVGFIDYTSNNSSPVGVSVDEVPLPFPVQTQGQLFDVARVEVLRGPQGTLYGRNTTGGAVNFVVNRPTREIGAGVSLEYASHDAYGGEAFVSGPLGESLAGRLSVATEQGGAWQRNRATGQKLGDRDRVNARAQLEFAPNDAVNVRLSLHGARDKSDAYGTQLIKDFTPASGGAVIPADSSPYATGWSLLPSFATTVGISPNSKPGSNNTNQGADLHATFALGAGVELTSITAYNKLRRRELGDWDATAYAESDIYFDDDIKVFSQELRLASKGTGPLQWVGGAYYSNEKLKEYFYGDFTQRLGASALTDYRQEGKSLGVFGQASWQFSDAVKGTLGLRREHETRDLIGLNTSFGPFPSLNGGPASRSLSNSDWSGKVGLDFTVAPQTLVYVSVSRGVKSGGFTAHNTVSDNPAILDAFAPEKLTALEVGVKGELGRTFRYDLAAFHYQYRDQQLLSKYFDDVSQSYVGRFINAPKSKIDGVEGSFDWELAEGVTASQYLGYKKGKFTSSVLNSDGFDFNGRDLDFPKLSYGGQLAWSFPAGPFRLRAETNYSYRDRYSQYFLLENNATVDQTGPQFSIDPYWLVNASVALSPAAGGPWTVTVWGHNVTNEKYYLTKNFFLPGTNIGAAGQPTTFGLRFDWAFGAK